MSQKKWVKQGNWEQVGGQVGGCYVFVKNVVNLNV
jgi:hypothetical protein